jgi:hypothetical protein
LATIVVPGGTFWDNGVKAQAEAIEDVFFIQKRSMMKLLPLVDGFWRDRLASVVGIVISRVHALVRGI